ncbi:MAG: ribonuclease HI family protein [Candidatus Dependentiae bacterium]|nr:ribonuclease HI family protein [Candidatus Dependentiae bacterium]
MNNKQLTFFSQEPEFVNPAACESLQPKVWKMHIDGASRNNPGPSGAGFCLTRLDETVCEQGFFLGKRTNNQAEYLALLVGVHFVHEFVNKNEHLTIYSDSQLLVRQMNKMYKIRDPLLKKMQLLVDEMLRGYTVIFCHVYREQNVRADLLANRGVDKKVPLPKRFLDILTQHEIF